MKRPETPEKLFTQVIEASLPQVLKLWEEGGNLISPKGTSCEEEIQYDPSVGRSYYQCNPLFWECFWKGGIEDNPSLKVDVFGQRFHLVARPAFDPIPAISANPRYSQLYKRTEKGFQHQYGYLVELAIKEVPGSNQTIFLSDTCRDTYLPQRIYGYGQVKNVKDQGFIWDNFGRDIFIDKFYVTNRQVNEWRVLTGEVNKLELDRKKWPHPALLSSKEQANYCAFYGKRVLEAKLFDAASMSPADFQDPRPKRVIRPDTPWQRDLSRTFLGMARINPDYQLTPLDCQLAQVKGCKETYFSTDSASWMGFNFSLGFYPEALKNFLEPDKNLKMSSHFLPAKSEWHQLGKLSHWDGVQQEKLPVAFRCYEEVIK